MVGYSSFGLIAVKGVQELKLEKDAEIASLREANAHLLQKISRMESTLEAMLQRLTDLEAQ